MEGRSGRMMVKARRSKRREKKRRASVDRRDTAMPWGRRETEVFVAKVKFEEPKKKQPQKLRRQMNERTNILSFQITFPEIITYLRKKEERGDKAIKELHVHVRNQNAKF